MLNTLNRKTSKSQRIQKLLYKAYKVCKKISVSEPKLASIYAYKHDVKEAIEELSIEHDLVEQLIEDYVVQVLTTKLTFAQYIQTLKEDAKLNKELDFTPLHELAHKNLGVARNLRIKDAEKILIELMTQEDTKYLNQCLEALVACSIRLKPTKAYDTIKLLAIKKTF